MGKTPGKWIKTLLLGKKSPKSKLENQSEKLRSAKKEEPVVSVTEDISNLTVDPPVVSSQLVSTSTVQNVVSPINGDESKDNLEPRNDLGDLELEQAAIKVQAAFRAHQKATLISAEKKKKDAADSVQIEPEEEVSGNVFEGGDDIEFSETEKNTVDYLQIEPEGKVSGKVLEEGDNTEFDEKEKDVADSVQIEPEENVLVGADDIEFAEMEKDNTDAIPVEFDVLDIPEEGEPKTAETNDKDEDLKYSDVKISSENNNVGSDNTKPKERTALLPAKIGNQDDGITHSERKLPSYMAPTASAKARFRGECSPRFSLEKTEVNAALRRHSLPSSGNGKLSTTTMSPRAHKLLLASAKGSINGDKSFTSSKNISNKSTRTEWKR